MSLFKHIKESYQSRKRIYGTNSPYGEQEKQTKKESRFTKEKVIATARKANEHIKTVEKAAFGKTTYHKGNSSVGNKVLSNVRKKNPSWMSSR